jgi:hypothetical protein
MRASARMSPIAPIMDDSVTLEAAWHTLNRVPGEAPQATIEALVFSLRAGVEVLREPDAQRRFSELSETQAREVSARLQNFNPHIATPWSSEEAQAVLSIWSKIHA